MTFLLVVIYIVFISLGLPDSLFGVAWPVVHIDFGINENFASFYSIITGICTGGVSFIAGKLIRKFGTGVVTFVSTLLTAAGLICVSFSCQCLCFGALQSGEVGFTLFLRNYVKQSNFRLYFD